ncbi:MAG: nucleoside triphosphate pyrophosphohydrolase [Bacteroidota bacterium]
MEKTPSAIPYPANPENLADQFTSFKTLVEILRRECPWDQKQTHETLSHLLIEESYETLDAITKNDDKELSKELGDLLLHIVMHSVIAEERGTFTLTDVLQQVFKKLVYRHPHVFGNVNAEDEYEVKRNWEELKMKEGRKSTLEGVPMSLPALLRAQRMQEKAANVGFDWDKPEDVWAKVEEEIAELKHEVLKGDFKKAEQEFGDVLFSLVNAARFSKIIAEDSLQMTNTKFLKRFQYIEQEVLKNGREMKSMTLGEMDELWNEAKKIEKS